MTVLVTGGAGYIGSHMVLALRERNEDVVVVDSLVTADARSLPTEAHFVKGDISDLDVMRSVIEKYSVSSIVHFAAATIVSESVANPLKYYKNNTLNTCNLIDLAIETGVKQFIFSSTAAVYGTPSADLVNEKAPLAPESPYGMSKLMSETMLQQAGKAYGLSYGILRYFNVAGADPLGRAGQSSPNATHLIKVAAEVIVGKRQELSLYGNDYPTADGTCVRDYIHVTDLIDAHVSLLDDLRAGGESAIFNCGYGSGYSVLQIIEMVQKVAEKKIPIAICPRRPGDPASIVADASHIKSKLGWKPQFADLETIVRHALAWERILSERANETDGV